MSKHQAALIGFTALATLSYSPARAMVSGSSTVSASLAAPSASSDIGTHSGDYVCDLSIFFSVDPDDRLDTSTATTALEGRGLVTCHNSQGFTTELPVMANLEAEIPKADPLVRRGPASASVPAGGDAVNARDVSFSANSVPFVIPREINQVYDQYAIREFSWKKNQPALEPAVIFRGNRNDLVMKMKLTSKTSNLTGIKVKSLRLSFDEKAPDIY